MCIAAAWASKAEIYKNVLNVVLDWPWCLARGDIRQDIVDLGARADIPDC